MDLSANVRRLAEKIGTTRDDDRREVQQLFDEWEKRIPRRFHFASLGEIDEPARGELLEWASTPPVGRPNLILLGPVGVGKTHAAVGALRVCHEHGSSVMFAPIVEVLDQLRPGGPPDMPERLASVRTLLLDDIGAERPTDWTSERLYGIVNRRWLNELPTIVTSNLSPTELEGTLDRRLFSRLVHDAVAVNIGGGDRRRA